MEARWGGGGESGGGRGEEEEEEEEEKEEEGGLFVLRSGNQFHHRYRVCRCRKKGTGPQKDGHLASEGK